MMYLIMTPFWRCGSGGCHENETFLAPTGSALKPTGGPLGAAMPRTKIANILAGKSEGINHFLYGFLLCSSQIPDSRVVALRVAGGGVLDTVRAVSVHV